MKNLILIVISVFTAAIFSGVVITETSAQVISGGPNIDRPPSGNPSAPSPAGPLGLNECLLCADCAPSGSGAVEGVRFNMGIFMLFVVINECRVPPNVGVQLSSCVGGDDVEQFMYDFVTEIQCPGLGIMDLQNFLNSDLLEPGMPCGTVPSCTDQEDIDAPPGCYEALVPWSCDDL